MKIKAGMVFTEREIAMPGLPSENMFLVQFLLHSVFVAKTPARRKGSF
jgi:hypothetical protein